VDGHNSGIEVVNLNKNIRPWQERKWNNLQLLLSGDYITMPSRYSGISPDLLIEKELSCHAWNHEKV
jgi:hypothetical protein